MVDDFPFGKNVVKKEMPSKKILILILLSLVILFSTTFALVFRVLDPLWNPFRLKPEKVLERMVQQAQKIKTSQGKTEFSLKITQNDMKGEYKVGFDWKTDTSQPEKPRSEGKFEISASLLEKRESLKTQFVLSGEAKSLDNTLYLKLEKFPQSIFDFLGFESSEIENQWIKIDQESIIEILKEISPQELVLEMEKTLKEKKGFVFDRELTQKVNQILSGKKIYLIKKELPDEKIGKTKVYHYLISLDNKEITKTILEIFQIITKKENKNSEIFPDLDETLKKELEKKLDEFFQKIGEIEGEIWIGKKDYLPYRISWQKNLNLSNFGENGEASITLKQEVFKFNQPLSIQPPSEFKNLKTIFEKPLQKFKLQNRDLEIINQMWQLRLMADLIYEKDGSFKNLCQNFKLNKKHPFYGTSLAAIENAIRQNQGEEFDLWCYSSNNSYCLLAKLASPERGRYCIDSSGLFGEVGKEQKCLGKGTVVAPYKCPIFQIISPPKPSF